MLANSSSNRFDVSIAKSDRGITKYELLRDFHLRYLINGNVSLGEHKLSCMLVRSDSSN